MTRSCFSCSATALSVPDSTPPKKNKPMHPQSPQGKLSTHVLDTSLGRPAAGIKIELSKIQSTTKTLIKTITTNRDGRCDSPLLQGAQMQLGDYELLFHVGSYFDANKHALSEPLFLSTIPIHFHIFDCEQNYHIPLLFSPWSYSTYRGS